MLISSRQRFVFIHIYKTGGTSIRKVLERYDDRYGLFHRLKTRLTPNPVLHSKTINKHSRVQHAIEYLGAERFKQYYSFAFVRNPWDWQLSLYFQILNDPTSHHYTIVKDLKNFENYVDWRVHDACRLQSDFLGVDGKKMVSYVGRYESLNADFEYIQQQIGIPVTSLPHLNNRQKGAYRKYYNETTRKMIQEAYQKDIDAFGYTF